MKYHSLGSIRVLGSSWCWRLRQNLNALIELRIYPGADGDYQLYEDAGDGWECEKGGVRYDGRKILFNL